MNMEICANSLASARNALAGGATRVELCTRLDLGGLTPAEADIDTCVHRLGLRTHVLLRPRAGDFCYTPSEYDSICHQVEMCHRIGGISAVVVGFLDAHWHIDEQRTRAIVRLAAPMEVTFHRAFDEMQQDPAEALEAIIRCGCHRLLTSGCAPSAQEGIPLIRTLVQQARGRITVMAGAGVTPQNAALIIQETGVHEIHASCKHTLADGTVQTDPATVRTLLQACLSATPATATA